MPDISGWLSDANTLASLPTTTAEQRAALAWRRINDKPASVVFRTAAGTDLSVQTVRVEYDDGASESESPAGQGGVRKLVIFGVRDHATVADSNLARGYRFVRGGAQYEIVSVIDTIGERQAIAERVG